MLCCQHLIHVYLPLQHGERVGTQSDSAVHVPRRAIALFPQQVGVIDDGAPVGAARAVLCQNALV